MSGSFRRLPSPKLMILQPRSSKRTAVRFQSGDTWAELMTSSVRLVGRPNSRSILESLFNEERANVADGLRHMIDVQSLNAHRRGFENQTMPVKFRGLFILLMSRVWVTQKNETSSVCSSGKVISTSQETEKEVFEKTRLLAELTAVIHISQKIHNIVRDAKVINTSSPSSTNSCSESTNKEHKSPSSSLSKPTLPSTNESNESVNVEQLQDGFTKERMVQKMENINIGTAILCGDYLMASALVNLASLRNPKVIELMMQSFTDWTVSKFLHIDKKCSSPDDREAALLLWKNKNTLAHGSLLTNACHSALLLSGNDDKETLSSVSRISRHVGLALQAKEELEPFLDSAAETSDHDMELLSNWLPLVLHPANYEQQQQTTVASKCGATIEVTSDQQQGKVHLRDVVRCGAGVAGAMEVLQQQQEQALLLLQMAPPSEARTLLQRLILHLTELG